MATRLIMLGTGGGPRPRRDRAATSHALIVDDVLYAIDCGHPVARQLAAAGVALPALRHVFVTHHHSDHNADYGSLLLLAWASGLRTRVDAWGPPPLEKMTRLSFDMNAYDIDTRIADEGRVPLVPLVHVHELTQAGPVMQDERVKITSALVGHPPVTPAFAFRSEEHTSEPQSPFNLVCRLLLEKKKRSRPSCPRPRGGCARASRAPSASSEPASSERGDTAGPAAARAAARACSCR